MTAMFETPWGIADSVEHVSDGITRVTTPNGSGYKLSGPRNVTVPFYVKGATHHGFNGWYSTDLEWIWLALIWPTEFPSINAACARSMLARWPDALARLTAALAENANREAAQ